MRKITKLACAFLLLLPFYTSYGQEDRAIDSIMKIMQNPKIPDTIRLESAGNAFELVYNGHPKMHLLNEVFGKLAIKNFRKSTSPALKKKFAKYMGAYYGHLGIENSKNKDVAQAINSYDKSIYYFKLAEMDYDWNYITVSKGIFYSRINEYEKALSCMFTGLRYFEKYPNKYAEGISYVQSNLAAIYADHEDYAQSVIYNKKVIYYYNHKQNRDPESVLLQATAYMNCGSSYMHLKNYPEAMDNLNRALSIYRKAESPFYISVALSKIAQVKMRMSKFDEAEALLKECLALSEEIPPIAVANIYIKLGELYNFKKDYRKADFYLTKGLLISKSVKELELQSQASELLYEVSKKNKDFEKALEMSEFQTKLADSTKLESAKNMMAQQQQKYEFEKKEIKTKLTAQKEAAIKNNWLIGLSGFLLLTFLGAYFYYRNSRQKQAITVLEKDQIKQKLLVSQMNPHFIFNSIQNIQYLIQDKKDKDAINYLDKFSALTRQILENSNESYISLTEEIAMIKNYMAIQQLLYNNKFKYTVSIEDNIDVQTIFLPPMLTQPFIENAIKHGLSTKEQNGQIDIHFYLKEGKLFFEVCDNGKGFDDSKKVTNHKSLAMTITKERLIGYTKNQNFIVRTDNIIDKDTNVVGAKVSFEIPYFYEN